MKFLKSLFKEPLHRKVSDSHDDVLTNWRVISEISQLGELKNTNNTSYFLIFKHSTRCPISKQVLTAFSSDYSKDYPVYYLDILNFREISNHISEYFNIKHESPQLLIIQQGICFSSASHADILSVKLP